MTAHEHSSAGTRREALRGRDDAVLARLSTLATSLDGEPDPAFRAAARSRLVAMAAVRTPGTPEIVAPFPVRARWRRRLTASLTAAAVAVTALAALIAIAAGSGPGDPLYGVKRGTEQAQLALAGDSRRGPVLLDLARLRLAEIRTLAGAPTPDPALLLQTLHTMDAQTVDAAAWFDARAVTTHSTAPLDQLSTWSSAQSTGLAALPGQLPIAVSTAVQHSLGVLTAARTGADAVRVTLTPTPRPPATGKTGSSVPVGGSPTAPTSVAGRPSGPLGTSTVPGGQAGSPLAPTPKVPTLPSPSSSGGIGGVLPTLPVPGASIPAPGGPLPSLPAPTGPTVCVGPIHVGSC